MFPLLKTLQSLKRAKLFGLIMLCAVSAVCFVVVLVVLLTWLAAHFVNIETVWLDNAFNAVFGIIMGIGGWFMLPVFTVLISGFFQNKVISRVGKVYYPETKENESPNMAAELIHDIKFTCYALSLNIVVLPFYFIGIGFVISIALNSYLLGREFFESVAGYYIGKVEAKAMGKKNRRSRYVGGLFVTVITLMPVINLFAPIIATVWMIHVYHKIILKEKGAGAVL